VVATGLVDHAEAIVAVVHLGEALEESADSLLGLLEVPGVEKVYHRVSAVVSSSLTSG
jgi:hypothetical protein